MFNNFWSWLLIFIIIVMIFYADNLPAWKKALLSRLKKSFPAKKSSHKTPDEKN